MTINNFFTGQAMTADEEAAIHYAEKLLAQSPDIAGEQNDVMFAIFSESFSAGCSRYRPILKEVLMTIRSRPTQDVFGDAFIARIETFLGKKNDA